MTTKGTDNRFRSLTVVGESGTPSTPASGDFKLYVADDGTFYVMDDTGTPTALGSGSFSDPMTTRGDIIVRNASNVTARLAKGSADTFLHSDGTDVGYAAVTDAMLSTSDITTNNASTSKHGFLKKLDNNAAHFMDGTGAWSSPSVSADPNIVPWKETAADPDSDDDEFSAADTDPLTGWTTLGTVTTLDTNTTYPDALYLKVPANAGTRVDGIYKSHTLAAGEAFVARLDIDDVRATFNRAGIFIGVASPGRIDTMAVLWNSSKQFELLAMTNPTTFSSTVTSGALANQYVWPIYLAIRCNSSTSYDYLYGYVTPAGFRWFNVYAARNPSITQATCGIFANAQNGSTAVQSVFGWARFYNALPGVIV